MSAFLLDTLIWTAVLIVAVLIVRRPVTRWLGAPTAYALWALPMLRLILPPLHLPAWLGPVAEPIAPVGSRTLDPGVANALMDAEAQIAFSQNDSVLPSGALSETDWLSQAISLPLAQMAFAVWAAGAAAFLFCRFSSYFRLRAELLADAREVGCAPASLRILPSIRLIETPGTRAPLAFGVIDPVIAMPPGFMAQPDRMSRDLALAHELAHHRGNDLLINVLVQPLFALHWFNPLSRYGWLALRRDQEAACDARVIATRPLPERALYAKVIASFAAGPNVALAAPMACPVLGDKSIVQRLRNLKTSQLGMPSPRRRLAARALLLGGALALPLTASITYAERAAPEPPAAPAAKAFAVDLAPPAPEPPNPAEPPTPIAPSEPTSPAVLSPPAIPTPPTPPTPLRAGERPGIAIPRVDPNIANNSDWGSQRSTVSGDRQTLLARTVMRSVNFERPHGLSDAERAEIMKDLQEAMAEADAALSELPHKLASAMNDADAADGLETPRTIVKMSCDGPPEEVSTVKFQPDGSRLVTICQSRIMAEALKGLVEARAAIAQGSEMQGQTRRDILSTMDRQIRGWKIQSR